MIDLTGDLKSELAITIANRSLGPRQRDFGVEVDANPPMIFGLDISVLQGTTTQPPSALIGQFRPANPTARGNSLQSVSAQKRDSTIWIPQNTDWVSVEQVFGGKGSRML